ncbi:MAG: TfoX/Sxy family protein [Luteimonas sp.]
MRNDVLLLGLKNIGPTIAARLEAVGITAVGELRRVGPAGAYNRVKANTPGKTTPVCYYLYSLQGALDGVHWDALPEKTKQELLRQI